MSGRTLKVLVTVDVIGCSILMVLSSLYIETQGPLVEPAGIQQEMLYKQLAESKAAEKSLYDSRFAATLSSLRTATQSTSRPVIPWDDPALQQLGKANVYLDMSLSLVDHEVQRKRSAVWLFRGSFALLGLNTVFLFFCLLLISPAENQKKPQESKK